MPLECPDLGGGRLVQKSPNRQGHRESGAPLIACTLYPNIRPLIPKQVPLASTQGHRIMINRSSTAIETYGKLIVLELSGELLAFQVI